MIGVTSLLVKTMNRRQIFTQVFAGACGSVLSHSELQSLSNVMMTMKKTTANISDDMLNLKRALDQDRAAMNRKLDSINRKQKIMAIALAAIAIIG
ncbi:MAG: hypothetical protein VW620_12205 [Rhodospirillales bacterium]